MLAISSHFSHGFHSYSTSICFWNAGGWWFVLLAISHFTAFCNSQKANRSEKHVTLLRTNSTPIPVASHVQREKYLNKNASLNKILLMICCKENMIDGQQKDQKDFLPVFQPLAYGQSPHCVTLSAGPIQRGWKKAHNELGPTLKPSLITTQSSSIPHLSYTSPGQSLSGESKCLDYHLESLFHRCREVLMAQSLTEKRVRQVSFMIL